MQNAWFMTLRHRPSADIIRNSLVERVGGGVRERVDIGGVARERVAECVGVGRPALLRGVIWIVGGIKLRAWAQNI